MRDPIDAGSGCGASDGRRFRPERSMKIFFSSILLTLLASALLASVLPGIGCSKPKQSNQAPAPVEVETTKVEQRDVPIYGEWIGTLDGMVNAQIKAQAMGYLRSKNYTEGSFVRKGQLLFEIDRRPLEAAAEQAKGDLAKAQGQVAQANGQLLQAQAQLSQAKANQGKTQLDVERYTPLAKERAITEQELQNAIQFNLAAKAQVEAAAAAVETARAALVAARAGVEASTANLKSAQLNLGFTSITSPIDGIAGIAQAQVGDLVSPSSQPLTTVSTVDPIKVYFTLPEQEYLHYVRRNITKSDKGAIGRETELELVLADGTTYPHKGKFFVGDREVNEKTGTIRLAGTFPNPGNTLRPGQYGRVRAMTSTREAALLVPQRAVTEMQGSYQAAVGGNENKVEIRTVKGGERTGSMWIIDEGLKAGETIVVEGTQRVRAGTTITPKPYTPLNGGPTP